MADPARFELSAWTVSRTGERSRRTVRARVRLSSLRRSHLLLPLPLLDPLEPPRQLVHLRIQLPLLPSQLSQPLLDRKPFLDQLRAFARLETDRFSRGTGRGECWRGRDECVGGVGRVAQVVAYRYAGCGRVQSVSSRWVEQRGRVRWTWDGEGDGDGVEPPRAARGEHPRTLAHY